MIVSDKFKFLFFELPRTGTTSIRNALIQNDIGIAFPDKRHISITEFFAKKEAAKYKDYKIYACVRNPLDRVLSHFLKMKRDHNGYFSKLEKKQELTIADKRFLKRYRDIQQNGLSFEEYFLKYFRYPYTDWMYRDIEKCDYVIRFENLNEDYTTFMQKVGISNPPQLPVKNKLEGKKEFKSYYTEPVQSKANYIYYSYMKKIGYQFPEDWKTHKQGIAEKVIFRITDMLYYSFKKLFK